MDSKEFLEQVDWETNIYDVRLVVEPNPEEGILAQWAVTVRPKDQNDKGSDIPIEIDYYLIDNAGNQFRIIDNEYLSVAGDILVSDDFDCGMCPQPDLTGLIVKSVGNGAAPHVSSAKLDRLDKVAKEAIQNREKDILWKYQKDINEKWHPEGLLFTADPTDNKIINWVDSEIIVNLWPNNLKSDYVVDNVLGHDNFHPEREYTISANTYTCADDTLHLIYAKLPINEAVTSATIVITKTRLFERYYNGFIVILLGIYTIPDDKGIRSFIMQWSGGGNNVSNITVIDDRDNITTIVEQTVYYETTTQQFITYVNNEWIVVGDGHPPVTVGEESADKATVGSDQVLHLNIASKAKNGIIEGGIVTWLYGLTYALSLTRYYIEDVLYTCPSTIFTLDSADLINPRIDVPTVTILGTVEVVKGTPAENPLQPSIDVAYQLELPFILLPANTTEPTGITDQIVYDENIEWAHSSLGVTVDFDNATSPFHESKCASVGSIGNNDTITFTADGPLNVEDYETLTGFLKLKAVVTSKYALYVQFRLAGVAITQELSITWSASDIVNWQNIALQFSDFTFNASTFDSIRLRWSKVQGATEHAGFYLDYIKLQKGVVLPVFVDTVELIGDVLGKGKTGSPIPTVLKNIITAGTFGDSTKTLTITVDSKGRVTAITENDIDSGLDGREVELSTSAGYVVWRYVGDVAWINLFAIPQDGEDGNGIASVALIGTVGLVKTYRITFTNATTFDYTVTDGADGTSGETSTFLVHIKFEAVEAFTYTCPYALKFTAMIHQQTNAPTLSVALDTNMAQYDDLVITPDEIGLVTLTGEWL